MTVITETYFLGHDNTFKLTLSKGGVVVPLVSSNVTRVIVRYGPGATDFVDSDDEPSAFDWATNGENGEIEFDFGELTSPIPVGVYTCTLVVYDPLHPEGQVWFKLFNMDVRANQDNS